MREKEIARGNSRWDPGAMKTLLAAIGLGALWTVSGLAGELPLDVFVVEGGAKENNKVDEGATYGEGQALEKTITYSLKVENKSMEPITAVTFKVYSVGGQNWIDKTLTRKKLVVVKVLEKTVDLPATASQEIPLGDVIFKSTITHNGNTTWYGGQIYDGYVLEISHDGKIDDVKAGNPNWRKAYDEYLQKNG